MSKQISVHNHMCTTPCEHADICYLVHGKHNGERISPDKIEEVIDKLSDKKVYYSGCNLTETFDTISNNVIDNDNRSITFSSNMLHMLTRLAEDDISDVLKSAQLTVYSLEALLRPDLFKVQKMFLIKNESTFNDAMHIFKYAGLYADLNIHFPIEHKWAADNKEKLLTLIKEWNVSFDKTLSLDSCLENYILNNKCVYSENYIDVRFDGTVRRCPFSDESHPINYDNPEEMFEIPFTPKCIWHQMFYKEA